MLNRFEEQQGASVMRGKRMRGEGQQTGRRTQQKTLPSQRPPADVPEIFTCFRASPVRTDFALANLSLFTILLKRHLYRLHP